MADYTMTVTSTRPYADTVAAVREELAEAGFGVLTEIDMQATLLAKLGVQIAPEIILGACNPPFAHRAIQADPSVAALLPCNVVVRQVDAATTVVEAFDPAAMARLSPAAESSGLTAVAAEARELLAGALARVAGPAGS